jgi:hypothetical protein
VWRHENRRSEADFFFSDYLTLDIDGGISLEEAKIKFEKYKVLIIATKSHQKPKKVKGQTVIEDRFRVIIPFDKRIYRASDYRETMQDVLTKFPFIDPKCLDLARFFYLCQDNILFEKNDGLSWPTKKEKKKAPKRWLKDKNEYQAKKKLLEKLNTTSFKQHMISLNGFGKQRFWLRQIQNEAPHAYRKKIGKSIQYGPEGALYGWYPAGEPQFEMMPVVRKFHNRTVKQLIPVKLIGWKTLPKGFMVIELKNEPRGSDFKWLKASRYSQFGQYYRIWLSYDFSKYPSSDLDSLFLQMQFKIWSTIQILDLDGKYDLDISSIKRVDEIVVAIPAEIEILKSHAQIHGFIKSVDECVDPEELNKAKTAKRVRDHRSQKQAGKAKESIANEQDEIEDSIADEEEKLIESEPAKGTREYSIKISENLAKYIENQVFKQNLPEEIISSQGSFETVLRHILGHASLIAKIYLSPSRQRLIIEYGMFRISSTILADYFRGYTEHKISARTIRRILGSLIHMGYFTASGYFIKKKSKAYTPTAKLIKALLLANISDSLPEGSKTVRSLYPLEDDINDRDFRHLIENDKFDLEYEKNSRKFIDQIEEPCDGQFNEWVFKTTAYFETMHEHKTWLLQHYPQFMAAKKDRWPGFYNAWRSHQRRKVKKRKTEGSIDD